MHKSVLKLKNYLVKSGVTDEVLDVYLSEINKELEEVCKYGLVWEDNGEDIDTLIKTKEVKLVEVKDKEIKTDDSKPTNLLIEGDNLESLLSLQYTHKGLVNVIYIDPPYNTGNKDFRYNDRYVDKEDTWRHSSWLSFMHKRLLLAKDLLADDGVIFISIDDNEFAQLKLLCDEVFGEQNFQSDIIVELTKTQGMKVKAAQNGTIVKNYEHILIYTKNAISNLVKNIMYDKIDGYDTHFSKIIIEKEGVLFIENLIDVILQDNILLEEIKHIEKISKIKLSIKTLGFYINKSDSLKNYIYVENASNICRYANCSITIDDTVLANVNKINPIEYKKYLLIRNGSGKVEQLCSLKDTLHMTHDFYPEYCRSVIRGNLWKGFYSDMMNVNLEGGVLFKNGKKPLRLLKQLFYWVSNNKNTIILDFFAGSGTTGHAVMELNKEDGGNRQFILCTNNENNICEEVTYQRLNKVINGYTTPKGKEVEGLGGNLKYYKTVMIDKDKRGEGEVRSTI